MRHCRDAGERRRERRGGVGMSYRRTLDFLLHDWLDVGALASAAALCRPFPRDLRLGARHLREDRAREVRAVQSPGRHRGAVVRRREGAPARSQPRRGAGLCRIGHAGGRAGLRDRRHAAAVRRRDGRQQLLLEGRHRHRRRRHADQRQCQPADGARHRDAAGGVRRSRVRRTLLRHDVPVRAAGRLQPLRRGHPRRARRRRFRGRSAGSALPAARQQDVDLQRRARAVGEHRPPGAGEDPRRRRQADPRHARHLAVHRAEEARRCRGRADRRTQRRRAGGAQPQAGLPRHPEHIAQFRRRQVPGA